jgi:hypothetical protein
MMRFLIVLLGTIPSLASAQAAIDSATAKFVTATIISGRYLSPPGSCRASERDLFGWAKGELLRCRYEVIDQLQGATTKAKAGIVYLANPTPERVLKWLTAACQRAQPNDVRQCIRSGASEIRGASGAQFPVAGLVWEDMEGSGINKGYVFRNGVTVRTKQFSNGTSESLPNDAALENLASAHEVTGVRPNGGFARVMSTSRAEFARFTGRVDIPVGKEDAASALLWSDIVGQTYREALSSEENWLVSSRVCQKYGFPLGCYER